MHSNVFFWIILVFMLSMCNGCEKKHFGASSFTCICNSLTCDILSGPVVSSDQVQIYTSTRDELRLHYTTEQLRGMSGIEADVIITLNPEVWYQSIIGFGAAFTDSSGLMINTLSKPLQNMLLRAYFTEEGANYNLCRIPIGGTDFSLKPYSYDDVPGDKDLIHFSLCEEDYAFKIPYIKKAMQLSSNPLYLFGSPWSPPSWMKTNGKFHGQGGLLKEMWQPWANYIVKFVEKYEDELGIKLWGLTAQNEPVAGLDDWKFNSCGWTPSDIRDWIAKNIGPTLEAAGLRRLKFMATDVTRRSLMDYIPLILESYNSSKYVDGISVHWYVDSNYSSSILDDIHNLAPEMFMMYSESCEGFIDNNVVLGSWERGESYITSIIETMNHWQSGWVDWNLALNMEGGPNWAGNFVDAPIIINNDTDEFHLQPMYYAITHFSKFVSRDARRINFTLDSGHEGDLHVTALVNPDETIVVILANLSEKEVVVQLKDEEGHVVTKALEPKSWNTVLYTNKKQSAESSRIEL